jgi:hypothetical protein
MSALEEAREALKVAVEAGEYSAHETSVAFAAQAHVLATIALAEEQRTANLLALLVGVNPNGVPLLANAARLRDAVADALTDRLGLADILTTYGDAS